VRNKKLEITSIKKLKVYDKQNVLCETICLNGIILFFNARLKINIYILSTKVNKVDKLF